MSWEPEHAVWGIGVLVLLILGAGLWAVHAITASEDEDE